MQPPSTSSPLWASLAAVLLNTLSIQSVNAAPNPHARRSATAAGNDDPFAVIDPQNWVNPDNMTWADWKTPPGTDWADNTRRGSNRK